MKKVGRKSGSEIDIPIKHLSWPQLRAMKLGETIAVKARDNKEVSSAFHRIGGGSFTQRKIVAVFSHEVSYPIYLIHCIEPCPPHIRKKDKRYERKHLTKKHLKQVEKEKAQGLPVRDEFGNIQYDPNILAHSGRGDADPQPMVPENNEWKSPSERGLVVCPECDGEESGPNCRCSGTGFVDRREEKVEEK